MIRTYRYRVKSLTGLLNKKARAVNYAWNFCNETQKQALKWNKKWPTGFELHRLTSGTSKELGISSKTINQVCTQYARSRFQHKRPTLRWRGKRSLGWIPIRGEQLVRVGGAFRFYGDTYRVFYSRPLPAGEIKDGSSFSRDAKGNWFLNVAVEVPAAEARVPELGVAIDLGLKEFAALSTGEKIDNPRHFEALELKLATAQRARKWRHAKTINIRISNARRDFLHKLSTRIVREFDFVAVGNVNAAGLAKTSMTKSINDVGWSSFRYMLQYKAITHGAWYEEVSERFTSQVCSDCGSMPDSRPKGIADLGIRWWVCSDCGAVHDRDVNAAINLLARSGHRAPVEGMLAIQRPAECQEQQLADQLQPLLVPQQL